MAALSDARVLSYPGLRWAFVVYEARNSFHGTLHRTRQCAKHALSCAGVGEAGKKGDRDQKQKKTANKKQNKSVNKEQIKSADKKQNKSANKPSMAAERLRMAVEEIQSAADVYILKGARRIH